MEKKSRLAGKNLFIQYKEVFHNLEELRNQIFLKLSSYEVSKHFIISEQHSGVFVYVQLSQGSRRLDTVNTAFFHIDKYQSHCRTVAGFLGFCHEVKLLLKGKDLARIGSTELLDYFETFMGRAGVKDEDIFPKTQMEDDSFGYINLQEQSTNYSSCRSPSSGIPSKDSSLSSTTEKSYLDRILRLEEENLRLTNFYETEILLLKRKNEGTETELFHFKKKYEVLEKYVFEMSSRLFLMQDQLTQLQEENKELKQYKAATHD